MKKKLIIIRNDIILYSIMPVLKIIMFIFNVIRHPFINISVWVTLALFWAIKENVEVFLYLDGSKMFVMSAGLVAIITFISTRLESQTIDTDNKENYYYGYNIKKQHMHDSFWLNRFSEAPIKLLFWITAILPVIMICAGIKYNSDLLESIAELINKNELIIESLWLAVYSVNWIYCIAVLIELIYLSRNSFSRSALYITSDYFAKHSIDIKIENYYEILFGRIFDRYFIEDVRTGKVEKAISYVFGYGKEVSKDSNEYYNYVKKAFRVEQCKAYELYKKVEKYGKNTKNKFVLFLFSRGLVTLGFYYMIKWEVISRQEDIGALELLYIANNDLNFLGELEESFRDYKEYREAFWKIDGQQFHRVVNERASKINRNINEIVKLLCEKVNDSEYISEVIERKGAELVVGTLNELKIIDGIICKRNIKGRQCDDSEVNSDMTSISYFERFFKSLIGNVGSKVDKVLLCELVLGNYSCRFNLGDKARTCCKELLMGVDEYQDSIIKLLLSYLNLGDIISALVFKLIYYERTKKLITVDEYTIWREAFDNIDRENRDTLFQLEKENYEDTLCKDIDSSRVSHYVFDDFLTWLWRSLFKSFDDEMIDQAWRRKKVLSMKNYIIFRLLLTHRIHRSDLFICLSLEKKKEIQEELLAIKKILNEEGIVI